MDTGVAEAGAVVAGVVADGTAEVVAGLKVAAVLADAEDFPMAVRSSSMAEMASAVVAAFMAVATSTAVEADSTVEAGFMAAADSTEAVVRMAAATGN